MNDIDAKASNIFIVHEQKPACMLHAPCSMMLLLYSVFSSRDVLIFSLIQARITLLLLLHYYIRHRSTYMCTKVRTYVRTWYVGFLRKVRKRRSGIEV